MGNIVGADGKPASEEVKQYEYVAGGLRMRTSLIPDDLLRKALAGAKAAAAQQAGSETLASTKSHALAAASANAAANGMADPFALEPAAMAVFMYLSREIEYRDAVIKRISDELVKLGADALDVKHHYGES